ncbi:MAG: hypothetical protein AAF570_26425 [Bacteroidota bacterium]
MVKKYLGVDVPSNQKGLLQDIHWSHGSFGYFPTYSLGSFYAAQFMHAAREAHPSLSDEFRQGNFGTLKSWLQTHVHGLGKQYSADDICKMATGEGLNVDYFMNYAKAKYSLVYDTTLT